MKFLSEQQNENEFNHILTWYSRHMNSSSKQLHSPLSRLCSEGESFPILDWTDGIPKQHPLGIRASGIAFQPGLKETCRSIDSWMKDWRYCSTCSRSLFPKTANRKVASVSLTECHDLPPGGCEHCQHSTLGVASVSAIDDDVRWRRQGLQSLSWQWSEWWFRGKVSWSSDPGNGRPFPRLWRNSGRDKHSNSSESDRTSLRSCPDETEGADAIVPSDSIHASRPVQTRIRRAVADAHATVISGKSVGAFAPKVVD